MSEENKQKYLFFFLTLIISSLICFPSHDFIPFLRLGDHGHDLYASWRTSLGEIPYRDYSRFYGPLMPFFYGACFKIGGITIASAQCGWVVIKILSSVLFFACLSVFIEAPIACLGALWFCAFNLDFFHTFNHIGATTVTLGAIYLLFKYIKEPRAISLYWIQIPLLMVFLIKFNIGLALLGTTATAITITPAFLGEKHLSKNRRLFFILAAASLVTVIATYFLLLRGLPSYYVAQCLMLPLKKTSLYIFNPLPQLKMLLSYLTKSPGEILTESLLVFRFPANIWATTLMLPFLFCLVFAFAWRRAQIKPLPLKHFAACLLSTLFLAVVNLHEFFLNTVNYKLYWAVPPFLLLIWMLIGLATRKARWPLKAIFFLIAAFMISCKTQLDYVLKESVRQNQKQFMSEPQARIYTSYPDQWTDTVEQVTRYLKENLTPEESFLAIPYEPLYQFLTFKKEPVRENFFCDSFDIPEKEEKWIISELERKKVNWVLVSNSIRADSPIGNGRFGETYCYYLSIYLKENFKPVKSFGDLSKPDNFLGDHSVTILRRK